MLVRAEHHRRGADFIPAAKDRDHPRFEVDGHQQRAIGDAFVVPMPLAIFDRSVDRQDPADSVKPLGIGHCLGCKRAMDFDRFYRRLGRGGHHIGRFRFGGCTATHSDARQHQRCDDGSPADPFQNHVHLPIMRMNG